MKIFSYGGGRQSVAVLVLAAQGHLQYDAFLFSNVGEDSENPDTLRYHREIAVPYAEAHGLKIVELTGKTTLRQALLGENKSIAIPAYMANGAPGNRNCTTDHKIKRIARYTKRNGATAAAPAVIGIGISIDEWHRARTDSGIPHYRLEYPLLDMCLSRRDCEKIISDSGLPVPPKSSCYFCPFRSPSSWLEFKRTQPELFADCVTIETRINEKRARLGRDNVYLHRALVPLAQAVGDQLPLWTDDIVCESGYCFV